MIGAARFARNKASSKKSKKRKWQIEMEEAEEAEEAGDSHSNQSIPNRVECTVCAGKVDAAILCKTCGLYYCFADFEKSHHEEEGIAYTTVLQATLSKLRIEWDSKEIEDEKAYQQRMKADMQAQADEETFLEVSRHPGPHLVCGWLCFAAIEFCYLLSI